MRRITGTAFHFIAFRFITGRTLIQPGKVSATLMDSERPFSFLFPDTESVQHLLRT